MNTARQLNYAYGNAVAVNLGVINSDNVADITSEDVARKMLESAQEADITEQANDNEQINNALDKKSYLHYLFSY